MKTMMPKLELGQGPKVPIDKALADLSDIILKNKVPEKVRIYGEKRK